jgi:hypothetical protein
MNLSTLLKVYEYVYYSGLAFVEKYPIFMSNVTFGIILKTKIAIFIATSDNLALFTRPNLEGHSNPQHTSSKRINDKD